MSRFTFGPVPRTCRQLAILMTAATAMVATVHSARADGPATAPTTPQVDNPAYGMWAKFKPGSSVTLSGDVDTGQMGKVHVDMTQTLKAVAADAVTIEVAQKVNIMGQTRNPPPQTQRIEAKEAKEDSKQTGTSDVQAMGKAYKCTVYEQVAPGAPEGGPKVTVYVSPDAPGGVVKMEGPGPGGKMVTMMMTAMDSK